MSSGRSLSKSICWPVVGWTKPSVLAWSAWRDYTRPSRRPFVVTQRVRRLLTVLFLLCLAVLLLALGCAREKGRELPLEKIEELAKSSTVSA